MTEDEGEAKSRWGAWAAGEPIPPAEEAEAKSEPGSDWTGGGHRASWAAFAPDKPDPSNPASRSIRAKQVPAGWYPHPTMAETQRYWDGAAWTAHIAPGVPDAYKRPQQVQVVKIAEADTRSLQAAAYVFAILLPIVGFILGIVLLAKGKTGPGAAAMILALLTFFIAYQIIMASQGPTYEYGYTN